MFNALTEEARNLLALCAAAGEPILVADVLAMAPDLFSGVVAVREAADQAGDRIYGDGEQLGFTVSDPELQAVWMTELQSSDEWSGWVMRFLDYGAHILEGLRTKELALCQVPACVVYGYGRALEAIDAPLEVRARLLCRAWADAWEWLGWPQGFQADAMRIFERASRDPANLGIMVLAGLCHGAVRHWVAIPPRFMGEALKRGLISPAQTLALADLANGHPTTRDDTLAVLYPLLPESYARQLDEEVAQLKIRFFNWSDAVIDDDGDVLPEEEADRQLDYFERATGNSRSEELIYKIIALVDKLPADRIERGLDLWEEAADFEYSFPTDVIPRLPERLVERVYSTGITMLYSGLKHATESGIDVLTMLLPRMTDQQLMNLIELHRITAKTVYSIEEKVSKLPPEVLENLLESLSRNPNGAEVKKAIEELQENLRARREEAEGRTEQAPRVASIEQEALSEIEMEKELAEIRTIQNPVWRISRLVRLAERVKDSERGLLVEEVLALLGKLPDEEKAAKILMELGPILNVEQAEAALDLARRVPLDHQSRGYASWSRSQAVLALAAALPEERRFEIQSEAVRWAREEASPACRERVFEEITWRLPAALRYHILVGVWELYEEDRGYKSWHDLSAILPSFSEPWFEMCQVNKVEPYDTLVRTLRVLMDGPIWIVSESLRAFQAVIYQLGGEKAIIGAIQADLDARIWWS